MLNLPEIFQHMLCFFFLKFPYNEWKHECPLPGLPLASLPKAYLFLWQSEYSWDNIPGLTRRPLRWGLACFTGRGSRRVSLRDVSRDPGLLRNSSGFLCVYGGNASYKDLLFSTSMCDICAGFSSFILWIILTDISVVFWNLGLYTAQPIWEKFFI